MPDDRQFDNIFRRSLEWNYTATQQPNTCNYIVLPVVWFLPEFSYIELRFTLAYHVLAFHISGSFFPEVKTTLSIIHDLDAKWYVLYILTVLHAHSIAI